MNSAWAPKPGKEEKPHDDGEGWLVSYADLVTLLFGFFVLLYSYANVDEKKSEALTKALAKQFNKNEKEVSESSVTLSERQLRALRMILSLISSGESSTQFINQIDKKVEEESQKKNIAKSFLGISDQKKSGDQKNEKRELGLTSKGLNSGYKIVIPSEFLFKAGTASIEKDAQTHLTEVAMRLASLPKTFQIDITGHTDSSPIGPKSPFESNWALSSARAGAVAELMIKNGVEASRISAIGRGSVDQTTVDKDSFGKMIPENAAKNRRVEIFVKTSSY